ncbi:MAG: DUF58 domain-containing protein [Planctomycetota bacterium]
MTTLADDAEIERLLAKTTVTPPRQPLAGRHGEMLGRVSGSSLEFQEFRQYVPGDDVRRVDWAAYARTETLMVRRFRDEISPTAEVVVDASRSMTTQGGVKAELARRLAAFLTQAFARLGERARLIVHGAAATVDGAGADPLARLDALTFDGAESLDGLLDRGGVPLRRNAFRIVISDLMFRHDPGRFARRVFGDANAGVLIQPLAAWEADPTPLGGRRLIDAERNEAADLRIDAGRIAEYRTRLERLRRDSAAACRRYRTVFVPVIAEDGLTEICRGPLTEAGLLRMKAEG